MMGSLEQKAALSEAWVKPSSHVGPVGPRSLPGLGQMHGAFQDLLYSTQNSA